MSADIATAAVVVLVGPHRGHIGLVVYVFEDEFVIVDVNDERVVLPACAIMALSTNDLPG